MVKVKNYEHYLIYNDGVIINSKKGNVLKPSKNQKGYLFVELSKNGYSKKFLVHRLVYETYIGIIENGLQINHIDGNKQNNCLKNLEVVTPKQNVQKAVECGLIKSGFNSKLSVGVACYNVLTNEKIKEYGSISIASKETGIPVSSISKLVNNKKGKSAGGFFWKKI